MSTESEHEPPDPPPAVDVLLGRISPERATIYLSIDYEVLPPHVEIAGELSGPLCDLAETLPTRVALQHAGPGPTHLLTAEVPDPVYWTPQLPARYRVALEIWDGGEHLRTWEVWIGLRDFCKRETNFYLQGKRYVLRGVHQGEAPHLKVAQWRAAPACMLALEACDALCEAASREGVLMATLVQGSQQEIVAKLSRLARHAAVHLVVLDGNGPLDAEKLRAAAPQVLLGAAVSPGDTVWRPQSWADFVMAPVLDVARFAAAAATCPLPVVAARPFGAAETIAEPRAACDRLQRDLAPYCQCAGYIV